MRKEDNRDSRGGRQGKIMSDGGQAMTPRMDSIRCSSKNVWPRDTGPRREAALLTQRSGSRQADPSPWGSRAPGQHRPPQGGPEPEPRRPPAEPGENGPALPSAAARSSRFRTSGRCLDPARGHSCGLTTVCSGQKTGLWTGGGAREGRPALRPPGASPPRRSHAVRSGHRAATALRDPACRAAVTG